MQTIVYIPSSAAAQMTAKLWELTDPQPTRGTTQMFPVAEALNGSTWLMVKTDYSIPVHELAELDGIADILQPWIDEGALPADTNAKLAAFVESSRGSRIVVYDAFPALFKLRSEDNPNGMGKSYEEMVANGLLPPPYSPP